MPRGVPQIEVTYDVDANGILNVGVAPPSTQDELILVAFGRRL